MIPVLKCPHCGEERPASHAEDGWIEHCKACGKPYMIHFEALGTVRLAPINPGAPDA